MAVMWQWRGVDMSMTCHVCNALAIEMILYSYNDIYSF